MKEFYVLNLDYRRIAILIGTALVLLGLTLFLGMAIGKGQAERLALKQAAEADAEKLGLAPEPTKLEPAPSRPQMIAGPPAAADVVPEKKQAAPQSEIPLREDPLVQGPPARPKHKVVAKSETEKPRRARQKSAHAEEEIQGQVNHTAQVRYTIQVAAFKRAAEAQTLIAKLKEEGIKARSEKSGSYYLVTVGRSKSKEKLSKALARLKELEYEPYIRKISKTSENT